MPSRRVVAVLLASVALVALSACTTSTPNPDNTPAVTTPQADISGEWVLTRTVVTSNDASNPARAVGATSTRNLLVDLGDCSKAPCDGTVSSGATLEAREDTALTQTGDKFEYTFTGALDCTNATSGSVVAVGGFEYSQTATFTVGESTVVDGADTASTLVGTLDYTDTVTSAALDAGCTRDPLSVQVGYAIAAVRAPVG